MFKQGPNGKGVVYGPNGIQPQWKKHYGPKGIQPRDLQPHWKRHSFIKWLFFQVVIVMVKDKKYSVKDAMLIKISFMH